MSRNRSKAKLLVALAASAVGLLSVFNLVYVLKYARANQTRLSVPSIVLSAVEPVLVQSSCESQGLPQLFTRQQTQRVHVVISTDCSPYQDWQSEAFVYAHWKQGFASLPRARVTRLIACKDSNWVPPKSSFSFYNQIITPSADPNKEINDFYPPRNRPGSLVWVFQNMPEYFDPDELVYLMDPDQIMLQKWDVNMRFDLKPGEALGAEYGQGTAYLKWAPKYCPECDFDALSSQQKKDLAIGAPYIMYGRDLIRIIPVWAEILEAIRADEAVDKKGGWVSDMFAYSIASVKLDFLHKRLPIMVSHPGIDSEPWELIRGLASIEQPLLVAHFCQTIKIREYKWGKHDFHKEMLRDCKRRPLFPEPTGETLTWVLNQSYVALKENKAR